MDRVQAPRICNIPSKSSFSDVKSHETDAEEWKQDNFMVMTCLLNSMKMSLSTNLMFHERAKAIWDDFCDMYFLENNASRIFKVMRRYLVFIRGTNYWQSIIVSLGV